MAGVMAPDKSVSPDKNRPIQAKPDLPVADPPTSDPSTSDPPLLEPLRLEDVPEPFVPAREPSEAQRDRVKALSFYSLGRTRESNGDQADALKYYSRALRYDPEASTVVWAVMRLAAQLEHYDLALRCAQRATDPQLADMELLRDLAFRATRAGDFQLAVVLYQKVLDVRRQGKRTVADVALRMEMAKILHLDGAYEEAADQFAHVLKVLENPGRLRITNEIRKLLFGDRELTHAVMGVCFLKAGRLDEAAKAFDMVHEIGRDDALLDYNRARIAVRAERLPEALDLLESYFGAQASVEGMLPYQLLEQVYHDLDEEGEADKGPADLLARVERLHEEDLENVPLAYFLAETLLAKGRTEEAATLYAQMLAKSPTVTGYRNLAQIYRTAKKSDELLDLLAQVSAKTGGLVTLGQEMEALREDEAMVDSLFAVGRRRLAEDAELFDYDQRVVLASLAMDTKRFEDSAEFYRLAMRAGPDRKKDLLLSWGLGLLIEDQFAPAAAVFQEAIDGVLPQEDEADFQNYLAGALAMDDRVEEALAAAARAVELAMDSPQFLARQGWIFYRADRLQEAERVYRKVVARFGALDESWEARQTARNARLALSGLAVQKKDIPQSVEWLEEVLDVYPDDVSALNDLGYLWADRGEHLQRAYRMIRQALDAQPDNGAYRDSLGWVLFRLGRPDEAIVELEAAVKIEPDPVVLDHLGDVYLELGRADQARDAWRRALESFLAEDRQDEAATVRLKIEENP